MTELRSLRGQIQAEMGAAYDERSSFAHSEARLEKRLQRMRSECRTAENEVEDARREVEQVESELEAERRLHTEAQEVLVKEIEEFQDERADLQRKQMEGKEQGSRPAS